MSGYLHSRESMSTSLLVSTAATPRRRTQSRAVPSRSPCWSDEGARWPGHYLSAQVRAGARSRSARTRPMTSGVARQRVAAGSLRLVRRRTARASPQPICRPVGTRRPRDGRPQACPSGTSIYLPARTLSHSSDRRRRSRHGRELPRQGRPRSVSPQGSTPSWSTATTLTPAWTSSGSGNSTSWPSKCSATHRSLSEDGTIVIDGIHEFETLNDVARYLGVTNLRDACQCFEWLVWTGWSGWRRPAPRA